MLLQILKEVKDTRGKKGRQYENWAVLFMAIVAIICGANSYRSIHTYIDQRFKYFKKKLDVDWKKVPSYTSIRSIVCSTENLHLEEAFRKHASILNSEHDCKSKLNISSDGKTIKGSYDGRADEGAIHFLNIFAQQTQIILGHKIVGDKTNEIPMFQEMLKELDIEDAVYTADAMHIQKKL